VHVTVLLERAGKEHAACPGHTKAFLCCDPLLVGFNYGAYPEDKVGGLLFGTAVFL
jgi:hypothetical protein